MWSGVRLIRWSISRVVNLFKVGCYHRKGDGPVRQRENPIDELFLIHLFLFTGAFSTLLSFFGAPGNAFSRDGVVFPRDKDLGFSIPDAEDLVLYRGQDRLAVLGELYGTDAA